MNCERKETLLLVINCLLVLSAGNIMNVVENRNSNVIRSVSRQNFNMI